MVRERDQEFPRVMPESDDEWAKARRMYQAMRRDYNRMEARAIEAERSSRDAKAALARTKSRLDEKTAELSDAMSEFSAYRSFRSAVSHIQRAEVLMQQAADACDRLLAAYERTEGKWSEEARVEAERSSRKLRGMIAAFCIDRVSALQCAALKYIPKDGVGDG